MQWEELHSIPLELQLVEFTGSLAVLLLHTTQHDSCLNLDELVATRVHDPELKRRLVLVWRNYSPFTENDLRIGAGEPRIHQPGRKSKPEAADQRLDRDEEIGGEAGRAETAVSYRRKSLNTEEKRFLESLIDRQCLRTQQRVRPAEHVSKSKKKVDSKVEGDHEE